MEYFFPPVRESYTLVGITRTRLGDRLSRSAEVSDASAQPGSRSQRRQAVVEADPPAAAKRKCLRAPAARGHVGFQRAPDDGPGAADAPGRRLRSHRLAGR